MYQGAELRAVRMLRTGIIVKGDRGEDVVIMAGSRRGGWPDTRPGVTRRALRAIGILVCVLLVLGALVLQSAGILWLAEALDELPSPRSFATIAVDEMIEAGVLTPSPDRYDPALDGRRILLTNAINEHTARIVVDRLFLLDGQDRRKPIDLYLSSPGGWGASAFTIIDAMHSIEAPVNAHALGQCYSSCALILAAGTGIRTAASHALLMVHANLDNSTAPYSYDRLDRARYETLWRDHAALPAGWFPMTSDRTYYLTPRQALEFKVIDKVVPARRR